MARAAASAEAALSFRVGGKTFSVAARSVSEVLRLPRMTRVPNAPESLAGLINFHGVAIPVVRLDRLLGGVASAAAAGRIIVYGQAEPVGLLVDEVLDIGATGGRQTKRLDVGALLAEGFEGTEATRPMARHLASQRNAGPAAAVERLDVLAFRLADQSYALPLDVVLEVRMLTADVAQLARSEADVIGMLDYRQSVLPLISLGVLLGLGNETDRRNIVVARLGTQPVGLVTGRIDGIRRLPKADIEPVPGILQRGAGDAEIEAIARVGGEIGLLSILSPTKLVGNHSVAQAIGQATGTTSVGDDAVADNGSANAMLQFVIFQLGAESYGLPIAAVEEVVHLPDMVTRLPHAPRFVAGVINHRGKALPVIDQRQRFAAPAASAGGRPRVLVVSIGALQAGFIVDNVSEILQVAETELAPAPQLPGDGARVFDSIAPIGEAGEMILVVDPKELLDRAERDLLASFAETEGSAAAS